MAIQSYIKLTNTRHVFEVLVYLPMISLIVTTSSSHVGCDEIARNVLMIPTESQSRLLSL